MPCGFHQVPSWALEYLCPSFSLCWLIGLCRGNKSSFTFPKFLIKYSRVRSVLMEWWEAARSVEIKPLLSQAGLSATPVLTGHTHTRTPHTPSIVPSAIFGHFPFWIQCVLRSCSDQVSLCTLSLSLSLCVLIKFRRPWPSLGSGISLPILLRHHHGGKGFILFLVFWINYHWSVWAMVHMSVFVCVRACE